ncbi:MAG: AAA family ATPase, partial [Pirellulales bacterium]|nr:AAA family ATPase [Pirellulales bacterium]
SNTLRDDLVSRLDTNRLFDLVKATGAADGGDPKLHGAVEETDLIAALRLFIAREQFAFPATHQGLGYNNLLYISLMLASLSFRASEAKRGQNAAIFPMLLIEEPEAHLHPALQHKLLSHIVSRVQSEPRHNRQVFVTTHSTHVTSAARLAPIICFSLKSDGGIRVSYPARLFADTDAGKASRGYVERYLDATKSTMLFAKATVFVEGIAEQLTVPALADSLDRSFDEHHVAVVRVDGVTFKHFLPLLGPEHFPISLSTGKLRASLMQTHHAKTKPRASPGRRHASRFSLTAMQRGMSTKRFQGLSAGSKLSQRGGRTSRFTTGKRLLSTTWHS